jgi:pSer/pThr/pTyr-binding forkhead associated (FHA) protein
VPVAGLSASREHAVILRRDAQYVLQNLNPQNQTNINDEAVYQEHVLRTGDIIQIGESVFRVGAASEESDGLRV